MYKALGWDVRELAGGGAGVRLKKPKGRKK
jgi:hypothetical protein